MRLRNSGLFKDLKYNVAAMALTDLRFSETALEADLDPRNVILWALSGAAMILAAGFVAVGLMRGGAGLAWLPG